MGRSKARGRDRGRGNDMICYRYRQRGVGAGETINPVAGREIVVREGQMQVQKQLQVTAPPAVHAAAPAPAPAPALIRAPNFHKHSSQMFQMSRALYKALALNVKSLNQVRFAFFFSYDLDIMMGNAARYVWAMSSPRQPLHKMT